MKNKKLYTSSYPITDIEHILRLPTAYVLIKKKLPRLLYISSIQHLRLQRIV